MSDHAKLLKEACDRFIDGYKLHEIKNISVHLRALVGMGRGNGLLFSLSESTNDSFEILALNQYGILRISEIEKETEKIIQEVEKKALITSIPGRLPILLYPGDDRSLYRPVDLKTWIQEGFLLDWEVPSEDGTTPKISRFSPQLLINRYTGVEGAHSDLTYGAFGGPVESLTMEYNIKGQTVVVPVVYEYLHQIGTTVSSIALAYVNKHTPE